MIRSWQQLQLPLPLFSQAWVVHTQLFDCCEYMIRVLIAHCMLNALVHSKKQAEVQKNTNWDSKSCLLKTSNEVRLKNKRLGNNKINTTTITRWTTTTTTTKWTLLLPITTQQLLLIIITTMLYIWAFFWNSYSTFKWRLENKE